jgi:glycosyltransferase involved in cell wall biosynthesis
VISTEVGGVVDLLGDAISPQPAKSFVVRQRGIGISSSDPQAFAEGLAYLIADVRLRREIGERGLQFVESRYSKNRLFDDIRALYAQLVKGNAVSVKARATENNVKSRVSP